MRKKFFVVVAVLTVLMLMATPVLAITYGEPDNGEHPYVGVVVFTSDLENFGLCSGTLIAPKVFLTAGHCAVEATYAWVSFAEVPDYDALFANLRNPRGWISGTGIAHPDFVGLTVPNTNDIGVILLDKAVNMDVYGEIAPLGFLDTYATQVGRQEVIFNAVGYGVNSQKPFEEWEGNRFKSEQRIINLKNSLVDGYNMMLTNSPGGGHGSGGTCSGDSGGPILLGGTNLIVAINSFGVAPWCKGNDYAYRVDIQNSYDFLSQFVDLNQ